MRDPIDFKAIRRLIRVEDALRRLGWLPSSHEPTGLRGWCPIHSHEPHRSRSLRVDGQWWYCYRCRLAGDVVEIWARLRRLGVGAAAVDLCREFGIEVPRQCQTAGTEKRRCPNG